MNRLINSFRRITETGAYGVCTWMGQKLRIKTSNIRLSFIYLSFITFGSPLIIYLIMAFLLEHKPFFYPRNKRSSVWDI